MLFPKNKKENKKKGEIDTNSGNSPLWKLKSFYYLVFVWISISLLSSNPNTAHQGKKEN
jgi:hypothetical protein